MKMHEMTETKEQMMRRLIYRASYTGMKETDLLLGQFAKLHLPHLSVEELHDFEAILMQVTHQYLHGCAGMVKAVPAEFDNHVFRLTKRFPNLANK